MSRRKIIKEIKDADVKEAEIVTSWSKKKIAVAIFLVIVLIFVGVYGVKSLIDNTNRVLEEKVSQERPQLPLPNQKNIEGIISNAKNNLSKIDADNVASSQPQIQKVIDDLRQLTTASASAKSLICGTICK
jgi:hypothetical protein